MSDRVRLEVSGRVQGVGFRWFTREKARRWGLAGWVRNRPDGSVEILVEGSTESIRGFIAMIRSGPPGSSVAEVRQSQAERKDPLPQPFAVVK